MDKEKEPIRLEAESINSVRLEPDEKAKMIAEQFVDTGSVVSRDEKLRKAIKKRYKRFK